MKKYKFLAICLVLSIGLTNSQNKKDQVSKVVKVACIGNSITYGARVANREKNAYPKKLQDLLGSKYQVENFGVSSNTLLKKGNRPYWQSKKYQEALSFAPDIVFIKLGTNDSKGGNRVFLDTDFEKDYKELIQSFKDKNENARVVLLLPVPSFAENPKGIWDPVITKQIIPLTQKVAYATKSEVIDLYQLFVGEPALFPDKIHPSSIGASRIARRLYEAVVSEYDEEFNLFDGVTIEDSKESNFYGFNQKDFQLDGVSCKIVVPKKTREGKPWVWRARFWGHEPQTDIALLERGFHVVYCDVSELYGAPKAVKRWNKFYKRLRKAGLSKKVVLEGMSRGGLIVYNWAAENPRKVSCIYADAPVLDGRSWPGGLGEGKGYPSGWKNLWKEYDLDSEASSKGFKGFPISKTTKLAKAKFPMFHVCGADDKVVPITENTNVFAAKIKDNGGDITVLYKEGVGHHPHSLKNPSLIVDFILRATGYKYNSAAIISPGSEYRTTTAGWKKGKGWWYQVEEIDSLSSQSGNLDLLLIGSTISQGWGGSRKWNTYMPGDQAALTYFKDLNWVNAGVFADRTEQVAWRIKNGHYDQGAPKFVSLEIGVNNFLSNTAEEIAEGIELNIELLLEKLPNTEILFFGTLPTGLKKDSESRKKHDKIHRLVKDFGKKKKVHYYNLTAIFSDEKGDLRKDYFNEDGVHLMSKGYAVWAKFIKSEMKAISSNRK